MGRDARPAPGDESVTAEQRERFLAEHFADGTIPADARPGRIEEFLRSFYAQRWAFEDTVASARWAIARQLRLDRALDWIAARLLRETR